MKIAILFLTLILMNGTSAEELVILKRPSKTRMKEIKEVSKTRTVKKEANPSLETLKQQGARIEEMLGRFQKKIAVWDYSNQYDFKTGTTIKGTLLNSIVSTNLESPLIVEVNEGESLPTGTRFSCKGITKLKRVLAICDKLITPNDDEEFEINASLLNSDGSSGLRPDEISTGKEEFIAGTIATAFSKGLIEIGTERVASPLGEITANTRRNRVTNGLLNSLDETNNIMNSEMKTKEPKAYIGAGRSVLIYFNGRFKR
ncbi:hypothetical protein DOM21_14880 [Bacteriovorax stolpii]|uniref:TrbI/VirB10 family protein n=1 Tax=Bacteriovorax stolpii TaxID=960 RepID=UPI001156FF59|nr:TrbI/VirB10 family protein [Bacteriovorax stolpii]QDK42711.1 hypothetical protein DOM21_14880 [Bacteriovorax stolpii]